LNFSLSPQSVLYGVGLLETSSAFLDRSQASPIRLESKSRLRTILEDGKNPASLDPEGVEKEFRSEGTTKQEEIHNNTEKRLLEKLETFRLAKEKAQNMVHRLQQDIRSADSQKDDLAATVNTLQQQNRLTSQQLQKQQLILQARDRTTKQLEKRLGEKVSRLSDELEKERTRSRLVTGAEKGLRLQGEKRLQEQVQRNKALNTELHQMKESYEKLNKEHFHLRMEVIRAAGLNYADARKLSCGELSGEFAKRLKRLTMANDRLTSALEKSRESTLPNATVRHISLLEFSRSTISNILVGIAKSRQASRAMSQREEECVGREYSTRKANRRIVARSY